MIQEHTIPSASETCLNVGYHVNKILFATDLSADSPQIFQYVLFMARQFNADVTALHVIDKYSRQMQFAWNTHFSRIERERIAAQELQETMKEMLLREKSAAEGGKIAGANMYTPEQLGVHADNKVVFGNVAEQILKVSKKLAVDLIVLGAHEKPLMHKYTNSISKRLLKQSAIPVTTIPVERNQVTNRLWS